MGYLDPDTCVFCRDSLHHALGGGALTLALWLTPLRDRFFLVEAAAARLVAVFLLAIAFEVGQADLAHSLSVAGQVGFGFGIKDLLVTTAGALIVEGLVHLGLWARWAYGRE